LPTTSPPTAASTSTPATASNWTTASRVSLRRKGATLIATRAGIESLVPIGGQEIVAHVGDWIVRTQPGSVPIAVIPTAQFPGPFEIVEDGTLVLSQRDREAIEATTGIGTTRSAADLLAGVRRLARIQIGEVVIPFTPGQIEELAHRAEKRGQTLRQAMQAVVDRIQDEIFWKA